MIARRLQDPTLFVPHASRPANEYNNPEMWTGGYPDLFPYNNGGPEAKRDVPVSLQRWVKHLLFHDDRFRRNQPFIFHVYNVLHKAQARSVYVDRPIGETAVCFAAHDHYM